MESFEFHLKNLKIFKSLFHLEYKDPKMESWYNDISNLDSKKTGINFTSVLLFLGVFTTTLAGVLYFTSDLNNRNLKWNFYFVLLHLIISFVLLMLANFSDFIESQNKHFKYSCLFLIHFCFSNFFLSLIFILMVYFKFGIEIICFVFFLHIFTKCLLSFFLHKFFPISLTIIFLNTLFKIVLLLGIHVIKAIIYFLILQCAFDIIVLGFVYMYEYMTRKLLYSFFKLAKEKEYFLDTLNYFNIYYFMTRNKTVKKQLRLNELVKTTPENKLPNISEIENMLKTSIVTIDDLPKELELYLTQAQTSANFKFKEFIKLLNTKDEFKSFFKKFVNTCVLKLNPINGSEPIYFQCMLKIKIKKKTDEEETGYVLKEFVEGYDVKIEGIFLDISQNYLKQETQKNSYILAKYIHDIKSPIFLLEKMIENYKSYVNSRHQEKSLNPDLNDNGSEMDCVENCSDYLKIISKYIFEIIGNINDFTKKQNNIVNYSQFQSKNSSVVNIRKFVAKCLDYYKLYCKFNKNKQRIKVFSEIDSHVPKYINSNKKALKQILMNLLSNALKFTYQGVVRLVVVLKSKLELKMEKKYLEINVIDTGIGIDKEMLINLGKPFNGLSSEKGSGLGLSIVNDLLASINSKLSIYSMKNKGSNFSFEIPANIEDLNVPEGKSSQVLNNIITSFQKPLKIEEFNDSDSKTIINEALSDKNLILQDEVGQLILNNFCYPEKEFHSDYLNKISPLSRLSSYPNKFKSCNDLDNKFSDFQKMYFNRGNTVKINIYNNRIEHTVPNNTIPNNTNPLIVTEVIDDPSSVEKPVLNILIIDDDCTYIEHTIKQIKMVSKGINIQVRIDSANDPIEALWKIYRNLKDKNEFFNVALIDEKMPIMRGSVFIRLYKQLSEASAFYNIPFVTVSSLITESSDLTSCPENNCYLRKPCRKKEMKNLLMKFYKTL